MRTCLSGARGRGNHRASSTLLPPCAVLTSHDRACRRGRDDGSAMVTVLLVLVIFMPMALAVTVITVQRQKDLIYERSRTLTVHVAEAGLHSATAALRSATRADDSTAGARQLLPCFGSAPLTGSIGAQAPGLQYAVFVRYYSQDPRGRSEQWRQDEAMACTPGAGPAEIPAFALLESAASGSITQASYASLRERAVEAVYRFAQRNQNVAGGLFHTRTHQNFSAPSTQDLCWAGAATPITAGTAALVTTCRAGDASQHMSYRRDYTLANLASDLCLTAVVVAAAAPLTFQTCTGAPGQKWTYNDDDHYQPLDPTGTALAPYCIAMQSPHTIGTALVLASDCTGPDTRWSPDEQTGTGGAGALQYQLVNYGQFARCFDVPDNWLDQPFMQVHPCKQNAAGPLNWWGQQLTWNPQTRLLEIGRPDNPQGYCVTATGMVEGRVRTIPCSTQDPLQRWTVNGATSSRTTSHALIDATGLCMAAGSPPSAGWTFSAIITTTCDGTAIQKWNAPPELLDAGLEGLRETTGS